MKKYRIVVLVVLMNAVLGGQNLFAHKKKPELPDHYLTFSFVIHPASVGYKHRVASSTYLTTNLDYVGDKDDLYFQVGAGYMSGELPSHYHVSEFLLGYDGVARRQGGAPSL